LVAVAHQAVRFLQELVEGLLTMPIGIARRGPPPLDFNSSCHNLAKGGGSMSVKRLEHIPGFHIDRVAAAAGDDPDVLRLENLDTDIRPPRAAVEATRGALDEDEANSWLPFTGRDDLKDTVAEFIERRGGPRYDGRGEIMVASDQRVDRGPGVEAEARLTRGFPVDTR
jgi:hypothetical protein